MWVDIYPIVCLLSGIVIGLIIGYYFGFMEAARGFLAYFKAIERQIIQE